MVHAVHVYFYSRVITFHWAIRESMGGLGKDGVEGGGEGRESKPTHPLVNHANQTYGIYDYI